MNILTAVILGWLGLNLVLVLLLWRDAEMTRRRVEAREAARAKARAESQAALWRPRGDAAGHPEAGIAAHASAGSDAPPAREARRVIAMVSGESGDALAPRLSGGGSAARVLPAVPGADVRHLMDLYDEIRTLRLTVAELSLDKARLTAMTQPRPRPPRAAPRTDRS